MNSFAAARSSRTIVWLNVPIAAASFALAVWVYWGHAEGNYFFSWSWERLGEVAVSAAITWLASGLGGDARGILLRLTIDRFCTTVGLNFVLQSGLAYLFGIRPTPWPAVVAGCTLTVILQAQLQRFFQIRACVPPVLLVGDNLVSDALLPSLGQSETLRHEPADRSHALPTPGDAGQLKQTAASAGVRSIVVTDPLWLRQVHPRDLLDLRYAGIAVQDGAVVFENLLHRVCWECSLPLDLLTSAALRVNRAAIVFEAVYTNVVGLGLLLAASPLLIVLGAACALATHASPFETQVCLGFQRMPFRLRRFRTRRANGERPAFGKLVEKLHLVNLPRLINVVRGEMSLFGPPPVREAYAQRLGQLLFAYVHRFAVKPGLMGWSQCNLRDNAPDEILRLEYDLYYIREQSPSLDLDILIRTAFRMPASRRRPVTDSSR